MFLQHDVLHCKLETKKGFLCFQYLKLFETHNSIIPSKPSMVFIFATKFEYGSPMVKITLKQCWYMYNIYSEVKSILKRVVFANWFDFEIPTLNLIQCRYFKIKSMLYYCWFKVDYDVVSCCKKYVESTLYLCCQHCNQNTTHFNVESTLHALWKICIKIQINLEVSYGSTR